MNTEIGKTIPDGLIDLAGDYHNSARAEIVQRITQRDAALFLFLAGAATLFGLSLSGELRPVLYAVPILGLGASQVFSQHSVVIGALGRYLGIESHDWLRRNYAKYEVPVQWDNSNSLLCMRRIGYVRPVYLSGLSLVILPQALALVILAANGRHSTLDFVGYAVGVGAIVVATLSIRSAHRARKEYARELLDYAARFVRSPGGSL